MRVIVVEFDKNWSLIFKEESGKIRDILGNECVDIFHIGSTSVPGLKAKPIIDIMPVVRDISKVDRLNHLFARLGYEPLGENGIPGRRYFRKGGDERTHQIHIFEELDTHNIDRHLALAAYLRCHPDVAHEYGLLKEGLALKFPNDIDGYSDGKDSFVKEMEQRALKWYLNGQAD
ncbi:MAG: GrpB family protein [Eubacteriaceae bacterium]|nr:GrpB family protein [Eubacteriaceae bacterium]